MSLTSLKNKHAGHSLGRRLTTLVATSVVAGGLMATSMTASAEADLSAVPSGNYAVDTTHAYIQFQYNHLGLSNPILTFDEFTMDMNLDSEDPSKSEVAVTIKADSVVTGSEIWHDHITGEKWFNTAANPEITFQSTSVAGSGASYQVTGDLTIKGVSKPVTLDVTINGAKPHPMKKTPVVGVSATGAVMRSDWELGANAPFVSDEVKLNIQAELIKG